jgi:hypothetical protein
MGKDFWIIFRHFFYFIGSSRVSVELAPQAGFGPPIRR